VARILRKIGLFSSFLILLVHSWAVPAKRKLSLSSKLGLAIQKSDSTCLYTHNADLSAGSPLALVLLSPPQSTVKAEVVKPATADRCPSIDASDVTLSAYEVHPLEAGLVPSTPAISVSEPAVQFQKNGDYVTADIDHDGHEEYFRFCASAEGLHLTVWSGKPLHGKPKWHQYYYLGYDVESNCTPSETQGP
jgi:hypothetical protein